MKITQKDLNAKFEQGLQWLITNKPAPEGYHWDTSWNGHYCIKSNYGGGESIKIYVNGNTTRERYNSLCTMLDALTL